MEDNKICPTLFSLHAIAAMYFDYTFIIIYFIGYQSAGKMQCDDDVFYYQKITSLVLILGCAMLTKVFSVCAKNLLGSKQIFFFTLRLRNSKNMNVENVM